MKTNFKIEDYIDDAHRKIFFFLPNFGCGGAEKFLIELAEVETLKGKDITIVVANSTGSLKPSKNIKVINFNKNRVALCLKPLVELLRRNPYSTLMTTMYHCNIITIIAKLMTSDIHLIIRESTSYTFYKNNFSSTKLFIFKTLAHLLYSHADELIFPSKDMRQLFLDNVSLKPKSISKIKVNPLNLSKIFSLADQEIHQDIWLKNDEIHTFISIGRLDNNKNHITIMKSIKNLVDNGHKNFELILIGDGELLEYLYDFINSNNLSPVIKMLGFQENPYKFLSKSDTFILSSLSEGYPNVLVQAQVFNLNIISSDCPTGPREILKNYKKSTLVPLSDLENLDTIMKKLI